ncbi:hypothetical protein OG895_40790 [Streptomyces sp. NBC_00201]|uniref:hypothetical protein n=1 Tax=unclassified Streptomyces TaxID=2593676 RepID=UPI00225AE8CF|nr:MULTISPECIES: hypothetical protein [unclassified Streptomyces]MCX5052263.1 hypothetical protein [Streptomyces sp. NBC_00474]MCX5064011.1 hypothetical protein [Streptomyces sp. NBC_00452]MCX5251432.1 hypothetical protein [Streptomyces sp. NBC_00201]MCX5294644.1 hypothetical protein [Streptomyces sp. NBC_00183]
MLLDMVVSAPRISVGIPGTRGLLRRAGREAGDDPAPEQRHHDDERNGDQDSGRHLAAERRLELGRAGELGDRDGCGWMSGPFVIDSAMRNSFQVAMKAMIAVVKMPGAASGMMTRRNA